MTSRVVANRSEEPAAISSVSGTPNPFFGGGARDILTAVGEVLYDWTLSDDGLRWSANVLDVLTVPAVDEVASGERFASFLDPSNLSSRYDAVFNSTSKDDGRGVPYQIQYAFLPGRRAGGATLWIEDTGRWYADQSGRPGRAQGAIRVINERYQREQKLAFLSRYDDLTGYYNRSHLLTMLGDAVVTSRKLRAPIAFLLVAVDNFRAINAAYGYAAADQVFAGAARRIKSALRDGDVIGRYSGNKLGLVLMNCEESYIPVAAERFHAAVRDSVIETDNGSVSATVSIGGLSLPRHANTVAEATARVQESLETARSRGNGHFFAYVNSPETIADRRENAERSRDLVAALDERRIKLAFQPVVDLATRKAVYHEALVRLVRRDGSLMPAREFVPLSERLGLVRLVDIRALELALDVLFLSDTVRLSVNISAESTSDSEWMAKLSSAVLGRKDVAKRLKIEITESAVIQNLDETSRFVGILHDLGCSVAIDDFGAGYTSFRNLRDLDIDTVKIDGAFVANLAQNADNQVFVRALIDIARNFGMETVAEWVADEETASLLAAWGVDRIQGSLTGLESLDWPAGVPRPSVVENRANRA